MEQVYFTNSVFLSNQGSPIYISHHNVFASGIILFDGNEANSGGGIFITNHSNIIFQNSDVNFTSNKALYDGGALFTENCNIAFKGNSIVTANNTQALRHGGAFYFGDNSDVTFEANCAVTINNTQAKHGGAIFIIDNSDVKFAGYSTVTLNKNLAARYGGGVFAYRNSLITFKGNSTLTITNNQAERGGGFLIWVSNIAFEGNSTLTINDNQATRGGALYIWDSCDVTFTENSKVKINNNQGTVGGAVYVGVNSNVTFKGNSTVNINYNQATDDGGALCILFHSDVTFKGDSIVNISYNQAKDGGALNPLHNSDVTFKENCTVTINNNKATLGGAFLIEKESIVRFEGNAAVTINNNQGTKYGGAFYIWDGSHVLFKGSSTVKINNNHATTFDGGAFYFRFQQSIIFKENCRITINNNQATRDGGAFYINENSGFTVQGNSIVTINNNQATYGGALYASQHCYVILKENCTVNVYNNSAISSGGALYFKQKCSVSFEENSFVVFYSNTANADGGALYAQDHCNAIIKGNSTVTFNKNEALTDGGALYASVNSGILFQASTTVQFNDNKATYIGGALHFKYNSNIIFENNCKITFNHNEASQGGAIFTASDTVFDENSTVQFDSNKATLGGALHISNLKFQGNTAVTFKNNEAELNGGALYSDNSSIAVKHKSTITFTNNKAENGGAIFATASTLLISEYSNVTFYQNTADQDGGAIYFRNLIIASFKNSSTVTMISNAANNSGGALYSEITPNTKYFNISEIHFISDNTAIVAGSLLYIDVSKSCNSSCLNDRILGISNRTLYQDLPDKRVSTSPRMLKLHHPAKCIDNNGVTCEKYYIENIMLGQEITINPCLLDYYNGPAEVTQFRIAGDENHQNYFVHGSEYTSISCDHTIEGIVVIGNNTISSLPLNYSVVFFTTNTTINSERKIISINLTIELTPCHPGFQYHTKSQKCECYNTSGIISCSDSSSAIRRGYWFGHVTGIPTVTFCPINYCNFTCCKTTNGYYHLSPVRDNQCKSHRSGTACGSCEKGYTLSFDSAECIDVNECNTGLIILVVMLMMLYWLVVVVAVFIIMYYQVGIGYFYVVTYYYSVVDIMLSQHTDISNGLYIAVTIVSSTAKVTPQFLGQLCLFKNMSGIDQQFIHYMHPLAVSVILIMISRLAGYSKKLSMFISRRITCAICFLLLLSYTSVATTSLVLMRSLTFVDVDGVYTYLSPDIKYFHGRHLGYGIVAIILALVIVIGLPLLLLLEPFLNNKINFFRIKPLLDQFQGCYKDKYRCFAAYYLICRLIIIIVIIANFPEEFVSRYLLITASTAIALIHVTVEPYADDILNKFDGAILHLMVLVTALPLFEHFDTSDSSFVVGIGFILVILPLILFFVMKAFTSKHALREITKNAIKCFSFQRKVPENEPATVVSNSSLTNGFDLIVDNNMRRGRTTIIELSPSQHHSNAQSSFMKVLNEIEDNQ